MHIKKSDLKKIKSIQKSLTDKEMAKIKKRAKRTPSGLPRGVFGRIKLIDENDVKKEKNESKRKEIL